MRPSRVTRSPEPYARCPCRDRERFGRREVETGGCGHKPRDASPKAGRAGKDRVEGARSCAHLASACGGRGFSPRLWRLVTAAPGSAARSSARGPPGRPLLQQARPTPGCLSGVPACPRSAPGRPRGQEEVARGGGPSAWAQHHLLNLTSGDACRPLRLWLKLMGADGHKAGVRPTPQDFSLRRRLRLS